jgi:L-ascorbate metabolism protein UlaG (beta-lactamase superfamily)
MSNYRLPEGEIRVHYLGHASFVLQFGDDLTVLTDYGAFNAWVEWGWDSPIHDVGGLVPDVITYSHTHHQDHCDKSRMPENAPHVLSGWEGLVLKEVEIEPVRTSERSLAEEDNSSYVFRYKGVKVVHLGDCQANIMQIGDEGNRKRIKELLPDTYDLLLMPIEGQEGFIQQAEAFLGLLRPKRVVPMHYWSKEYKRAFLSYLGRSQETGGWGYQIEQVGGARYAFSVHDSSVERVSVVSLEAEPFSG